MCLSYVPLLFRGTPTIWLSVHIVTLLISHSATALPLYAPVDCYEDDSYINDYEGYHDNIQTSYFVNGIAGSVHNNSNHDRRFKWRYCRQKPVPYISYVNEIVTPLKDQWRRDCENNSAIIGGISILAEKDRTWVWYCGQLDTTRYVLTSCTEFVGYVTSYDDPFSFFCALDGVMTGVYSYYSSYSSYGDRIWGFKCCGISELSNINVTSPTIALPSYAHVDCYEDDSYINEYEGYHDNIQTSYFVNGIAGSVYSNHDRRFKWRYCRQQPVPYISYENEIVTLAVTFRLDDQWRRDCENNSAIIGGISVYDVNTYDRQWVWYCGQLDTTRYVLTSCTDTGGYVTSYDNPFSFFCALDGVMTAIYSTHYDYKRDRIWGFRCCGISELSNINVTSPTIEGTTNPTLEPTFEPTGKPTIEPTIEPIYTENQSENEDTNLVVILILICIFCAVACFILSLMAGIKIRNQYKVENQSVPIQNMDRNKCDYDKNDLQIAAEIPIKSLIENEEKQQVDEVKNNNYKSDTEELYVKMCVDNETKMEIEMYKSNMLSKRNGMNDGYQSLKAWFDLEVNIPNCKNIYYQLFVDNGYDTLESVQLLNEDKLRKMKIKNQGHIDKIMLEITHLKFKAQCNEIEGVDTAYCI